VKVAIVGGTGDFGLALACRLVEVGDEVVIGSRDPERAHEKGRGIGCGGDGNALAVGDAELVVLATEASAAVSTAHDLRSFLRSPVLCVASRLAFDGRWAQPPPEPKSVAETVSDAVDVPVVAGLQSLAAGKLAHGRPEEDAFVCGDDADAKELALELAAKVVAGRALDAGPLASARALEGMTAVVVNLNKRYKGHAGLRVTGLTDA
jgi:8-hydroxy-5-deazaflavin:NADPH oxidoreductase